MAWKRSSVRLRYSPQKIPPCRWDFFYSCDPGEARTPDPLIKSQLLYQLSYEVITFFVVAKKSISTVINKNSTVINKKTKSKAFPQKIIAPIVIGGL